MKHFQCRLVMILFSQAGLYMLFSDIERTFLGPKPFAESEFAYLDRSGSIEAKRVREVFEAWYNRFPIEHQDDLRARFRSPDRIQHISTSFELYLHEILSRLGYRCVVHPETPSQRNTRPDFLASHENGQDIYVEAVFTTDIGTTERGAKARLNVVCDRINQLSCPDFYLNLHVKRIPRNSPAVRKLIHAIEAWITAFNPDSVAADLAEHGHKILPIKAFKEGGLEIVVTAWPRSPQRRDVPDIRPLGALFEGVRWSNTWKAMRDNLISKAHKYGRLDHPFVIALNVDDFHVSEDNILQALLGQDKFLIDTNNLDAPPIFSRSPDGLWMGNHGPRYTRVSAVLITGDVMPWTVAQRGLILYHNPWAAVPLNGPLCNLKQVVIAEDQDSTIEGLHPRQILDLSDGWPKDR